MVFMPRAIRSKERYRVNWSSSSSPHVSPPTPRAPPEQLQRAGSLIPKIELKRLGSFWIEQIPLFSARLGLVAPHRLLTWVWSTPKQAIPLIYTFPYPLILTISNGENGSLALHNPSKFH